MSHLLWSTVCWGSSAQQREPSPVHPRSLMRKRSVSTPPPAFAIRILTATGALTGLTHSRTQRDSAPGSSK